MRNDVKFIILAAMFFFHIIDEYCLQGILSDMKQRQWWRENVPGKMYSNDYIVALLAHAFSWSFVMSAPLLVYAIWMRKFEALWLILYFYAGNTSIHMIVDDQKANEKKINLITDQSIHIIQILITWILVIAKF